MKKKNYMITILLLGFYIINSAKVGAIPLTNSQLSISDLNGTNGFTILDSKRSIGYFSYDITFVSDVNNDGCDDFCVAGRTNLVYYTDVFFSKTN